MASDTTTRLHSDADDEERDRVRCAKFGPYDNPPDGCPNCARRRVMRGDDGKHRCEKCFWCIEDGAFDGGMADPW